MGLHLHIDPFSGIAGDMFIGALLDLGVELGDLRKALAPLPVGSAYRLTADRVLRRGIGGVDFKVHVGSPDDSHANLRPQGHAHHEYARHPQIRALIDHLDTTDRGRDRARKIVDALARAEAQVHGKPIEEVHFHEVGAVDSIVDMLGSAVGLELLGVDSLSCGALPITRGYVRCDHGRMPVPAPATAYLMRGMATIGVDRAGEFVTPTGAAIAAALCESFGPPPPMSLIDVGYGAGDRDEPEVPNLVRLFLGRRSAATAPTVTTVSLLTEGGATHDHHHDHSHSHTHPHEANP
ncbi:MAG: LarC family nickel insertion protein [Planctomycetes bacterium]|nr:LarC family nickel insertion protein [Planctomycetota bacterium]